MDDNSQWQRIPAPVRSTIRGPPAPTAGFPPSDADMIRCDSDSPRGANVSKSSVRFADTVTPRDPFTPFSIIDAQLSTFNMLPTPGNSFSYTIDSYIAPASWPTATPGAPAALGGFPRFSNAPDSRTTSRSTLASNPLSDHSDESTASTSDRSPMLSTSSASPSRSILPFGSPVSIHETSPLQPAPVVSINLNERSSILLPPISPPQTAVSPQVPIPPTPVAIANAAVSDAIMRDRIRSAGAPIRPFAGSQSSNSPDRSTHGSAVLSSLSRPTSTHGSTTESLRAFRDIDSNSGERRRFPSLASSPPLQPAALPDEFDQEQSPSLAAASLLVTDMMILMLPSPPSNRPVERADILSPVEVARQEQRRRIIKESQELLQRTTIPASFSPDMGNDLSRRLQSIDLRNRSVARTAAASESLIAEVSRSYVPSASPSSRSDVSAFSGSSASPPASARSQRSDPGEVVTLPCARLIAPSSALARIKKFDLH